MSKLLRKSFEKYITLKQRIHELEQEDGCLRIPCKKCKHFYETDTGWTCIRCKLAGEERKIISEVNKDILVEKRKNKHNCNGKCFEMNRVCKKIGLCEEFKEEYDEKYIVFFLLLEILVAMALLHMIGQ